MYLKSFCKKRKGTCCHNENVIIYLDFVCCEKHQFPSCMLWANFSRQTHADPICPTERCLERDSLELESHTSRPIQINDVKYCWSWPGLMLDIIYDHSEHFTIFLGIFRTFWWQMSECHGLHMFSHMVEFLKYFDAFLWLMLD